MKNQMKLSFSTLILLCLLAVIGTSCSKEDAAPINDDPFLPPSAAEFNGLREIALQLHSESALFEAVNSGWKCG